MGFVEFKLDTQRTSKGVKSRASGDGRITEAMGTQKKNFV